MFDVSAFTEIVTPPQVAIVATARAGPRVVVREGEVVVQRMMTVTLSPAHRVVNGAAAARFLETLKGSIECPDAWPPISIHE